MISNGQMFAQLNSEPIEKQKNKVSTHGNSKQLSTNAFISGVKSELKSADRFLYIKEAKNIIAKFEDVQDINEADKMAKNLLTTLCGERYSQDERARIIFRNSPIFSLLFLPASENNEFEQTFKKYIYANDSREQHILYSIMNMSYFGTQTSSAEAINKINKQLSKNSFKPLLNDRAFDNLVITCIEEEENINKKHNLDSNISGLRMLSRLLS